MKKLLIIVFLPLYLTASESYFKFPVEYLERQRERQALEEITKAIMWIESRNNDQARGAADDLGCLQITPIKLRDYNKRTSSHYQGKDLFNRAVSVEIFTYYAQKIGVYNYEEIARTWNTGSFSHSTAANNYWYLVQKQLNK